ncbi:MAG: nitroreductase [Ancrocorticia sp.]|nr:nitroreductase [Ancrocorticia sp.]MCI2001463.1 nitroreductase [Ancrocorticia sp.]
MHVEDFSKLVRSRYSARDFTSDPIPPEVMDGILDDARYCASWSNTRAYCVALAQEEQLERLRHAYTAAFDESLGLQRKERGAILKALLQGKLPDGDFKVWREYPKELKPRSQKVGKGLYTAMGVPRGDRVAREAAARRNVQFFGAPAVMWLFVHKRMLPFSAQDGGILLQNIMLAAKARGVDSCPLGTLAVWRNPVEKEFQIPQGYKLITGLALGYATDARVNEFRAEHPPIELLPPRAA